MILLVGLGNPGQNYQDNRHNIGFMAVDEIAHQHGFSAAKVRFQGLVREGTLLTRTGPVKAMTLKPATYMNESGRSVGEAVRFYKLTLHDVIVFHDEVDLAPGKLRVKTGGGHAGNNGIRSIQAHLGPDFRRVRLGVGHPGQKGALADHVLRDFSKADQTWLKPLLDEVARATPYLAESADSEFMNKITLALRPDEEASDDDKKT